MSICAACSEPLTATTVMFAVTEFGPLGESPKDIHAICSPECLRDLGIDLRIKETQ